MTHRNFFFPDFFPVLSFAHAQFGKKEMRILMVGLDAAGKTTILYKLKLGEGKITKSFESRPSLHVANHEVSRRLPP